METITGLPELLQELGGEALVFTAVVLVVYYLAKLIISFKG